MKLLVITSFSEFKNHIGQQREPNPFPEMPKTNDPSKVDPTRINPDTNDPSKVDPTRINPGTNDPRKNDPTHIPGPIEPQPNPGPNPPPVHPV